MTAPIHVLIGHHSAGVRELLAESCRASSLVGQVEWASAPAFFSRKAAQHAPALLLAQGDFLSALGRELPDAYRVEVCDPGAVSRGLGGATLELPATEDAGAHSRFASALTVKLESARRFLGKRERAAPVSTTRPPAGGGLPGARTERGSVSPGSLRGPQGQRAPSRMPPSGGVLRAGGQVIAIGASTGGTVAIESLLCVLAAVGPPIMIAQHISDGFSAPFARRLNGACRVEVQEAVDGQPLQRGHAYIAPADRHLLVGTKGGVYQCQLSAADRVNRHRPSVDLLFGSMSKVVGAAGTGILLTGMGRDGAKGLLAMARAGAKTIAQDEATSVVWGMPGAAKALGAAQQVLSLDAIGGSLQELFA